jgi:hypothetical protein
MVNGFSGLASGRYKYGNLMFNVFLSLLFINNTMAYYHRYSNRHGSSISYKENYIKFRLQDLINPDRNKTFIDNLYARFSSNNQNEIELFYIPMNKMIFNDNKNDNDDDNVDDDDDDDYSNAFLLDNSLLNRKNNSSLTNATENLLNKFYLTAKLNGE